MAEKETKDRLGLSTGNYILMIIAIILIVIGYIIMSRDEITYSVILLTLAYVVLIPLSLFIRFKKKD